MADGRPGGTRDLKARIGTVMGASGEKRPEKADLRVDAGRIRITVDAMPKKRDHIEQILTKVSG